MMTEEEKVEYRQLKRLFEENVTAIRTFHTHWQTQARLYGYIIVSAEENELVERKLKEHETMSKRLRELIFK